MDLTSLFADAVGRFYDIPDFILYPLIQEEERQLYRVDRINMSPCLLRAYAYPQSMARQEQHANVLKLLEKYGYPAPRLILTRHGQAVTEFIREEAVWQLVMTIFIEGDLIEGDAPATLRCMGEALGHFHRFSQSLPVIETQNLAPALWRPAAMIPLVQQQLAAIKRVVSTADRSNYGQVQRAIDALPPFHHLPAALNHSDCVPTNAVRRMDGQVVLIDWADAGWGELILDLAWLLIMGMGSIPDGSPTSTTVEVDKTRLYAVIDGYCHYRVPTSAECAMLLDAIRFVPVVYSGLEFCAACRQESSALLWQGWWARYQAAPLTATLVVERITHNRSI